jgi:hypothetical protein
MRCNARPATNARSDTPCIDVDCAQLDPSLSQYQISEYPKRSDSNAIFFPLGEKFDRRMWNAKAICWAIRGQPQLGLRGFISTTA